MDQVLAKHQGQVAFAKDQDPVQQFAAEGSDHAFADGLHPWRLRRGGDDPQPSGLEHLGERGGEERIAARWSFRVGGDVETTPVVAGGLVYVGSSNGDLSALPTTGD
ncbi:PQQ-binding-like beta-propeller repeat protein [Streptosporangium sp. NPDC005286]|uniref:PQQ-binding-like beta-propeller repeat protein n=1 Tax=Streptosporangium sp. NPDC005286 TaxID=3154463 RepID=UPI0033AD4A0E